MRFLLFTRATCRATWAWCHAADPHAKNPRHRVPHRGSVGLPLRLRGSPRHIYIYIYIYVYSFVLFINSYICSCIYLYIYTERAREIIHTHNHNFNVYVYIYIYVLKLGSENLASRNPPNAGPPTYTHTYIYIYIYISPASGPGAPWVRPKPHGPTKKRRRQAWRQCVIPYQNSKMNILCYFDKELETTVFIPAFYHFLPRGPAPPRPWRPWRRPMPGQRCLVRRSNRNMPSSPCVRLLARSASLTTIASLARTRLRHLITSRRLAD